MRLDTESYKEMSNLTGLTYMKLELSKTEQERMDKCRLYLAKANYYLTDTVHVFRNQEDCDHILARVKTWIESALNEYTKLLQDSDLVTTDSVTSDNLDGQAVEDISLEKIVSYILLCRGDARFVEEGGHPIIKYHNRNYYLDSLGYAITKQPHFITLLFQDMDSNDMFDRQRDEWNSTLRRF